MDPQIWGPHGWFFLHSITMCYPLQPTPEEKEKYLLFFKSLSFVLPCDDCCFHFQNYLIKYPIENSLDSRQSLVKWLIDIHNMVNISNGKPTLSYHEVEKIYNDRYRKKKCRTKLFVILFIIFTIFILFLLFFIFYKNKNNKNVYLLRK